MEIGFYHPQRGYWQAIDVSKETYTVEVEPERVEIEEIEPERVEVDDEGNETVIPAVTRETVIPAVTRETSQFSELLATYADGTVEVPLKPGADFEWQDGEWIYVPPALDLLAYAAQKRWEKEVGGTEVAGMPVFTDDRSKTLIMGARQAADADPDFTTQWKAAAGAFITLDAAMIMAISNAVLAHVASCFAREAAVIAAIEDGTITSAAEIDDAFDAVEWPLI